MDMKNCIFCKIIKEKKLASIIYENDKVICFLPKKLEVYGHTLIVSKKHYTDLYNMPEDILCDLIKVTKKLTLFIKRKLMLQE